MGEASAQPIGTFSWQTQPYCNVITVTVVQQGAAYQLVGSDNLCGAGTAAVTGSAVPTPSGVQMGLTVAQPTGRPAHLSATIGLGNLAGPWIDADGRTGTLAFGGNAAGTPRPAPSGGPRRQVVTYVGETISSGGRISPPAKLRDLGTFTTEGGAVQLTWSSHVMMVAGGEVCNFQIRVDGQPDVPLTNNAGLTGGELVHSLGNGIVVPGTVTVWYPNLTPGTHTIELWLRSLEATCIDNPGNYFRRVIVEEFGRP
jgi:hypothetical protein